MKVEKIAAMALNFSHAEFENDIETSNTRDVIKDDTRIDEKMDETMRYLNNLSDEKKCDIEVKLDYNSSTNKGDIIGEIHDNEGKKNDKEVRVQIDASNDNSVVNRIDMFKNHCSSIIKH